MFILGTFLVAMVKALLAYTGSKNRYLQTLSANLYFQNLANNSGALTYLVDSAEAEEAKEMLLAYFLLYVEREREYTREALAARGPSRGVRQEFGLEIDFQVTDALRKLLARGLVVEQAEHGNGRTASERAPKGSGPGTPARC